jgi:hypothetical protein
MITLKPQDVAVLLQKFLTPVTGYRQLAEAVGLSVGEAHKSVRRLVTARLLTADPHAFPNRAASMEFLVAGVPYVFPGTLGAESRGVPTAHSAPLLNDSVAGSDSIVWPYADGEVRGAALEPMLPTAPRLANDNPALYHMLSLVDAIRVGRARERTIAASRLSQLLESAVRNP